jgi:hypothetical protein
MSNELSKQKQTELDGFESYDDSVKAMIGRRPIKVQTSNSPTRLAGSPARGRRYHRPKS